MSPKRHGFGLVFWDQKTRWEENGLADRGREPELGRAGTGTFGLTMGRASKGL